MRVFLEDNQDDNVALLDTGADANFIFSGVVSALKVMRIPCKEEFRLGDGITFHQVNEKITVKLRILKKDKTYTTPYTETFFLTGGSIDGYDIVLGKRFCQDKEALIKNKSFAVMVHKQSKGERVSQLTLKSAVIDMTAQSQKTRQTGLGLTDMQKTKTTWLLWKGKRKRT